MKAGFTLIEILVVIAIIGILISALMFNGAGVMKRGRLTAAENHGRTVSLAVTQWLSQSPAREASSLNGRNCAVPGTLNSTGLVSGFQSGALGWSAPKVPLTCTIDASGRTVNVTTSTDGVNFINGERQ